MKLPKCLSKLQILSVQTSRQQKKARIPLDFVGLLAPEKAGVRPLVPLGQVDDGESEGWIALHAEQELSLVNVVTVGRPVGLVGFAQVLHFAAAGDHAVPGDRFARELAAAAFELQFGLELSIANVGVLLQDQAPTWEHRDKRTRRRRFCRNCPKCNGRGNYVWCYSCVVIRPLFWISTPPSQSDSWCRNKDSVINDFGKEASRKFCRSGLDVRGRNELRNCKRKNKPDCKKLCTEEREVAPAKKGQV